MKENARQINSTIYEEKHMCKRQSNKLTKVEDLLVMSICGSQMNFPKALRHGTRRTSSSEAIFSDSRGAGENVLLPQTCCVIRLEDKVTPPSAETRRHCFRLVAIQRRLQRNFYMWSCGCLSTQTEAGFLSAADIIALHIVYEV